MYLVDTNVLSAASPTNVAPSIALVSWIERNSAVLFLSVVTVAEVEQGIAKTRREGALRKAERLIAWMEAVLHLYGDRILPIDTRVARRLGLLSDRARSRGAIPGWADLAIAATAVVHGYSVLTRNVRHFDPLIVPTHDPFGTLPPDGPAAGH